MKKNHSIGRMQKAILVVLVLSVTCLAAGCGNRLENDTVYSGTGDMAGNKTPAPRDSVLDKGGANGTDNDSILDYLNDDPNHATDSYETDPLNQNDLSDEGLLESLGSDARDITDDLLDGADDLTTPSTGGVNEGTGTNGMR